MAEETAVQTAKPLRRVAPAVPPEVAPAPAGDKPPAAPLADPAGKVPRVIPQLERSPGAGLVRFKVRVDNYQKMLLYILARSRADAEAEYLKASGLEAEIALLTRDGLDPYKPRLVVTELPD